MSEEPEPQPLFHIETVEIPNLPDSGANNYLDIRYPLLAPYVTTHIYYNPTINELLYDVEEPQLNEAEEQTLHLIEEGIQELINLSVLNVKTNDTVITYLEKNIQIILNELGIKTSQETFIKLMYYVYRDFVGLNQIEPIMKDYFIEDIECNGLNTPIYIVHRKYGNIKTNIQFNNERQLESFVEKLAQKCGKYISYAKPLLDAQLPDGSRINATFSQDISARGPSFSIRKFTKEPYTPVKLMQLNTASPELLAYLWILIENEANIMIIGATGAGKTSLINSRA
ncbi:MAG: type II/IV secretion system ATPase subunit, partial [Nanoarchaeota archaeon]|nr:type II/IV secretion system ATPase subunit [Nanoarchaeota archaeon]